MPRLRLLVRSILPALMGLSVACTVEIPQEARPVAVRALWDPSTSTLPSPTNLVLDETLGRLQLPIEATMTAAEREFREYLNQLDGYPLPTTLSIPLSGPIAVHTLPGTLVMIEVGSGRALEVTAEFDEESRTIKATARDGFLPGMTYIVGLWGYEGGVRGANGEPVVADAAFYMVRQPYPLSEHGTAMPGQTREEREGTAERLELVQEEYEVLFRAMEQRGIVRNHVATASSFTMTRRPAISFDSARGEIPMPNNLLIDPLTGLVELPIPADADEDRRVILEGLSSYDGFAISGAVTVKSTHRLGSGLGPGAHLDPSLLRLFTRKQDGGWEEVDDVLRGQLDDGKTLWLRPSLTLEPARDYAYVVSRGVRDARGLEHEAQPLGAMLRLTAPLEQDGAAQISGLSDEQALRLEPHREGMEGLIDSLVNQGVARSEIAAAVPFRTTSAATKMLEMRSELYTRNVPTRVYNVSQTEPTGGLRTIMGNISVIFRGEITILDHLDPRTRSIQADHPPVERRIKFSLTLPRIIEPGKKVPMVLFGHGLMTSRELLYLIGDELAKGGYGALSIDLPYHGARSVCIDDSTCQGQGTCNEVGQCVNPDGSPGTLVGFELPYLIPFLSGTAYDELLSYPITSGQVFVDVENLFGTRDHFSQALLDLSQAVRVLKGPHLREMIYDELGVRIDGDDLVYLGMSLGGILGASLSGFEPLIETFVLNVPGANLVPLIENSATFQSSFAHALEIRGLERDTDAYFAFANALRWILDPVDPLNIAHHATLDPLEYVDPVDGVLKRAPYKRVLIQMAEGDAVVPNIATRALAERMQVPLQTYRPLITNHGFLFDPNPLAPNSVAARKDMIEFFDAR